MLPYKQIDPYLIPDLANIVRNYLDDNKEKYNKVLMELTSKANNCPVCRCPMTTKNNNNNNYDDRYPKNPFCPFCPYTLIYSCHIMRRYVIDGKSLLEELPILENVFINNQAEHQAFLSRHNLDKPFRNKKASRHIIKEDLHPNIQETINIHEWRKKLLHKHEDYIKWPLIEVDFPFNDIEY